MSARPRLSGFCGLPNVTQGDTGYNPHHKCTLDGCTCKCHTPDAPAPAVFGGPGGVLGREVFEADGEIVRVYGDTDAGRAEREGTILDRLAAQPPPPGATVTFEQAPPRPKVPLACLQGQHTATCGHQDAATVPLEDPVGLGIVPAGRQAGKATVAAAVAELTDEERRLVIAAHLELRPDAALGAVVAILERRARPADTPTQGDPA